MRGRSWRVGTVRRLRVWLLWRVDALAGVLLRAGATDMLGWRLSKWAQVRLWRQWVIGGGLLNTRWGCIYSAQHEGYEKPKNLVTKTLRHQGLLPKREETEDEQGRED